MKPVQIKIVTRSILFIVKKGQMFFLILYKKAEGLKLFVFFVFLERGDSRSGEVWEEIIFVSFKKYKI